jgi:hypothetical protein
MEAVLSSMHFSTDVAPASDHHAYYLIAGDLIFTRRCRCSTALGSTSSIFCEGQNKTDSAHIRKPLIPCEMKHTRLDRHPSGSRPQFQIMTTIPLAAVHDSHK